MNCNKNCRQGRDCNCAEQKMFYTTAKLTVFGFLIVIFFGIYL